MPSISVPLVFVAGLLSFFSPCVLPMVPIYLGYLSGTSLSDDAAPNRWRVFSHALFFVAGFSLVFVILFGLPTTILSSALYRYSTWITRIGGAILILFSLHIMGIVTIPMLNMTRRVEVGKGVEPGYLRSTLFGVTFAAGWTPCIGPLLGTVVTLAFTDPSRSMGFLLIYTAGLAVPFLVTALLLARAVNWLKRMNKYMRVVEIVSGLLMLGVGLLLITGKFSMLNVYFNRFTPEWLLKYM